MIDDVDRKILGLLSANARLSIKSIAAHTGLSRTTVRDRLRRLERTGTIVGYTAKTTVTDHEVVRAFMMIKLKHYPDYALVERLNARPEVKSLSSVSGECDLLLEAEAPKIDEINGLWRSITVHDNIANLTTLFVLDPHIRR